MIDRFVAKNFQSLHSVDLKLDKLTVIVGPSSSGKSALVRAIRILARNSNSSNFVTHGRKSSTLAAVVDGTTVILERGPGKSVYTTIIDGNEEKYTKCGTTTPNEIAKFLRLLTVDGTDVNFAGQFDRPFLLDDSATLVAKVLGDLTNINILFDAVREANRRRLANSSELRVRSVDLETHRTSLEQYRNLPAQIQKVTIAKKAFQEVLATQERRQRLEQLILETGVLSNHFNTLTASVRTVPDIAHILELAQTKRALEKLVLEIHADQRAVESAKTQLIVTGTELTQSDAAFHQSLEEAGECPLCGASTKERTSV